MGLIFRVRQCGSVLPWRQLATVLAGVAVIVAMVAVAETGRRDELHHQRVQVLVEQVRGSSHEIGELAWQGIAAMSSGGHADTLDATAYLSDGFQIWSQLSGEVNSLRVADHSAMTVVLLRDAGRLFTAGMAMVRNGDSLSTAQQGLRDAQTVFAALDALDRDSLAAASAQQRVASQAATREGVAYIGSLLIGLVLLVLLGLQLYRIRRRSLLVEQRQAVTRRAEERVRALVEHSSDIITVVAPDLTVRWQSSSLERALGHPVAKLVGQRLGTLVHPDDAQLLEAQLSAATGKPGTVTFTARFRDADGGWRHLEAVAENRLGDPAIEGVVLSMRDISERKALEDELRQQAFHDSLTGLANRALFEDRLAHGLAGARRHGRPVAVLFLDLDDFKTINDSLGHASGDELLRAVARRIAGVVRVTDTAARLGGDEFAVLLEVMDDEHDGEWIAKRLLEELAAPFRVAERDLRVGASIGVAVSDGSIGIDELLRNADTAMYAAKDAGKGTVKPFEEGMHKQVLDRLELTGELQHALEHDEFELDYQPIVDLQGGHVTGAEALVRWAHPDRGRLAPANFISLAEETGLIVPLGVWILKTACAQAAAWQHEFPNRRVYMNVNVSTRQLHDLSFPQTVADALRDSSLEPERLVLEITESLLPDDNDHIIAQLRRLKALGAQIAVDDFGTGYSALSRLQAYPVDILKIDRSFINGIERDPGKGQLVRGIVDLGESLHMSVVAEGIEEPEQAEQLRELGSPLGQGYLFSRPVAAQLLQALLQNDKPLTRASEQPVAAEPTAS